MPKPPVAPAAPIKPPDSAPVFAPAARKAPAPSGIVPALDFDFPTLASTVSQPTTAPTTPVAAVKLPSILEPVPPLAPAPIAAVVPPAAPEHPVAPTAPPPPPSAAPRPVAPRATVRLVELGEPGKPPHDQWRELAHALAKQLWRGKTATPPRATVIEAFLHAMPMLFPGGAADQESAETGVPPEEAVSRWREPFAGAGTDHVVRFERPDFEGIAERVAEMIERWLLHQDSMARQPGADAEEISFSMVPERHSAVVSFGMNYMQRDTGRRKRVACWVARVGENRFLFVGKIPSTIAAGLPSATQASRQAETGGEPAVPLPREAILALPPASGVDAETALTMRRLIIRFCEAHFARYDNRLAAEIYDQIRRRRDVARAVLPEVLRLMPPSKEKRMLQQVHREM